MKAIFSISFSISLAAVAGACLSPEEQDIAAEDSEVRVGDAFLIQPGRNLIVYGATDDNFVIYQDGPTLYATRLAPGAPRHVVAEVGANQPLVMVRGRVAFVWTDLSYFGPGGVSPLIIWTAAAGPQLASEASIGSFTATRAVAVRPDGGEVLFIANANAAGTIGDLVSAAPDLASRRTLVAGANVDFSGTCPPLVGFDGPALARELDRHDPVRHPVAAYCPGAATTATLSRWVRGARTDLSTAIALPPRWSSDADGRRFVAIDARTRFPVSIRADGGSTVLEEVRAIQGFIDVDGRSLVTAVAPEGNQLHRLTGRPPHADVVADLGAGFYFNSHFDEGFRQYTDFPTSRDGRLMLFATAFDPMTGVPDLNLLDVEATPPAAVKLQPVGQAQPAFELFTADSSHALYYKVDGTTPNSTLFAASPSGANRQVSSGTPTEFVFFAVKGSDVVYSDHMDGTGVGMFDLHDLMLADVGAPTIEPRLLAGEIYNLFFMTRDRRWVVYTSDRDPLGGGLLAVRAAR